MAQRKQGRSGQCILKVTMYTRGGKQATDSVLITSTAGEHIAEKLRNVLKGKGHSRRGVVVSEIALFQDGRRKVGCSGVGIRACEFIRLSNGDALGLLKSRASEVLAA